MARLRPENKYSYFYGYYSDKLLATAEEDSKNGRKVSYNKKLKALSNIKKIVKTIPILKHVARSSKAAIVNVNNKVYEIAIKRHKRFDLYFEPNFIPLNIKAKKIIVTLHDLGFLSHPEWSPKDRLNYFNKNFEKNIGRADKIIVVSDFIKKEAMDMLGLPEDKFKTIYHGFDASVFRQYKEEELREIKTKYTLEDDFILSVGSIEPRKNLERLIKAYLAVRDQMNRKCKLLLVGHSGWENKNIMKLLKEARNDVHYLGYVSDNDLGRLYNLATLFVFPSLYEGFGLPALEAMACGCPTLVSNTASLPEVCQNAALYVNPLDINDIAEGMLRGIENQEARNLLKKEGPARAQNFNWKKSAEEHLLLFDNVIDS